MDRNAKNNDPQNSAQLQSTTCTIIHNGVVCKVLMCIYGYICAFGRIRSVVVKHPDGLWEETVIETGGPMGDAAVTFNKGQDVVEGMGRVGGIHNDGLCPSPTLGGVNGLELGEFSSSCFGCSLNSLCSNLQQHPKVP